MHKPKVQDGRPKPIGRTFPEDLLVQIAQHEDHDHKIYGYGFPPSSRGSEIYSASPAIAHEDDTWPHRTRSRVPADSDSIFPPMFFPRSLSRSSKTYSNTYGSSPPVKISLGFRIFQIASILIVGICLYALVDNILFLIRSYGDDLLQEESKRSSVNIHEQLQSWIIHGEEDFRVLPSMNSIAAKREGSTGGDPSPVSHYPSDMSQRLNHASVRNEYLTFILNNSSVCSAVRRKLQDKSNNSVHSVTSVSSDLSGNNLPGQGIYFMIVVHSAPDHFTERQAIRSTWGSVKSLKNLAIRLVFILGKHLHGPNSSLENSIKRENELFGDIVIGNFVDSYRNLTYKHLLGYQWVRNNCMGATFILKTDDDAFVDIFQLFDYTSRNYGLSPKPDTLICNVFPEGTKPVREKNQRGSKWAVTLDEYPLPVYPRYCGGLAYLATPMAVKKILAVSDKVKFFWIDDVFVTGILRELAEIEPFYLNLRYLYDPAEYRNWLLPAGTLLPNDEHDNKHSKNDKHDSRDEKKSRQRLRKFPFLFAHVERGDKFSEEMNDLWRKTLRSWSQ